MMNHVYLIMAVVTVLRTSNSYKILRANWTTCHYVALHEDSYHSHLCEAHRNKTTKEGNVLIECEKEHPGKNTILKQYVALNKLEVPEKNNTPFLCLGQYSMSQDYGALTVELQFDYSRVIGAARILEKGQHVQGVKLKLQISQDKFHTPASFTHHPKDKEFWIGLYRGVPINWLLKLKIVSHNSTVDSVPIRRSYFSKLSSTALKEIEIYDHSIEGDRLTLPSLPHLRKLILQRINLTIIDGFHAAPNLEEVDLSGNYIKNFPQVFSRNFLKLRILNLSRNRIHFMFLGIGFPTDSYGRVVSQRRVYRFPVLTELDLSHNEIKDLAFPFTYSVVPGLATLNLSYCQIDHLPIARLNPFRYMPSLMYLDLSHNNIMHLSQTSLLVNQKFNLIDFSENKLVEWPVFDYCEIRFLNLSGNNYTSLNKLSLNHSKIEYLDLSSNRISEWNETDIFYYPKGSESGITKVNLSYNAIGTLSKEMLISLKALGGIDIGNISADCDQLLRWSGREHIQKIYRLGRRNNLGCNYSTEEDPPTLAAENTTALPVNKYSQSTIAVSTTVILLIILLCIIALYGIVFRPRFDSCRQRDTTLGDYEVFICFSGSDRKFVLQKLVPLLQKDMKCRLYLHDRDFFLGKCFAKNVGRSVEKCRKALLVLSNQFIKKNWHELERDLAIMFQLNKQGNFILLLLLEPLQQENVPESLKLLMESANCLEWPLSSSSIGLQEIFKSNISEEMKMTKDINDTGL